MKISDCSQPLMDQVSRLSVIVNALIGAETDLDKLEILNRDPVVQEYISQSTHLQSFLAGLNPACDVVIKSVAAIGQGPLVFQQMESLESPYGKLREMIDVLLPLEKFYASMGGLVGYHLTVLRLLIEKQGLPPTHEPAELYTKPEGLDLSQEVPEVYEALRSGIESLPKLAEIYPVGGAGDRLQLRDEYTGELLPVAYMRLCGKTLLEWLIRDLQAREYLYYKLTGKLVTTPIAMMTSLEKQNHDRIYALCEEESWFGRPKDSFRFFTQPMVPVISEEGNWCLREPLKLILKPGGHGVMWKLAKDQGVFSWLDGLGRSKALIRQINNPVAGVDIGLLAFTGVGFKYNKSFGFASCFRVLNAAEGMNVLLEKRIDEGFSCTITNIEYTDFAQRGIADTPAEPGSLYSAFPANTNILFADLNGVIKALEECPIPGTILNMKGAVECLDSCGGLHQVRAGRLESTMQNIADYIVDLFPQPITLVEQASLKTYVTYNERHRTISVTKKSYSPGQPLLETPEGCFYDLQRNAHDLLYGRCSMAMPCMPDPISFSEQGPTFVVDLHPALGPSFDIIAAKIRGGVLHESSDLTIQAAEVDLENLNLTGSLQILADDPLGHRDADGQLVYSERNGKCSLKNVKVVNKGINWSIPQRWWKGNIQREETLLIIIHGNGEFHAQDVTIKGGCRIEVPDGCRVEAVPSGDGYRLVQTELLQPSWSWQYAFGSDNRVSLFRRG